MIRFSAVWEKIEAHAGDSFRQIRGGEFKYSIQSGHVVPDRTNHQLARSQFEKAFGLVPLENTTSVQHLRGPSYLYAILMDSRIRGQDW